MNHAMVHRGPDGEGYFRKDHVGLGHRRLSIIDLDKGGQPLYNEDKTVVVVFNGEIYNYRELTHELVARGHHFSTKSDTEVLVHLYEEYGEEMLAKLRGMFAFALYDLNNDCLLLARDRFGIKPLYYHFRNGTLYFASEIKPLIAAGYTPEVMGMAAYGEPKYVDFIESKLYRMNDDTGEFSLNLDYFAFQHHGMRKIWDDRLLKELGPARDPAIPLAQRDYDMAASAQLATERFGLRMAQLAKRLTGADNLCMAGGVIQNVLLNQRICDSGIFKRVFAQPLASDVGCSLGGALYYHNTVQHQPRKFQLEHLYWGPEYRNEYEDVLLRNKIKYHKSTAPAVEIAKAIADGAIVGFVCGRMEAGPRALGARSILADPRRQDMKETLNLRVKHREHFRPFAPACMEEHLAEVFDVSSASTSYGYMITTASVRPEWRDRLPTITHNDGTARPQAVNRKTNPLYWEIIHEFYKLTGVPLVVNTSFNDNEPIVCTPQDAVNCFRRTRIDLLALEDYLAFQSDNLDEKT